MATNTRLSAKLTQAMRRMWLVFLLFIIPIVVSLLDTGDILQANWVREWFKETGGTGMALYFVMVAMLPALGVPRQALAALGGYAFGMSYGFVLASIGLIAGCAGSFYAARYIAGAMVQQKLGPRLRFLDTVFATNPFRSTFMLRLCPLGNNALLNLAAGVSSVPAKPFFAASFLGYMPQSIVFAMLGGGISAGSWQVLTVSCVLLLISMGMGFHIFVNLNAVNESE